MPPVYVKTKVDRTTGRDPSMNMMMAANGMMLPGASPLLSPFTSDGVDCFAIY
jgi:hypothetical protein